MRRTRENNTETRASRRRGEHPAKGSAANRDRRRSAEHADDLGTPESFQLFLNQAGRFPLLTAAEELELAKASSAATFPRRKSSSTPTCASSFRSRAVTRASACPSRTSSRRRCWALSARSRSSTGAAATSSPLRDALDPPGDSAWPRQHGPPSACRACREQRADAGPDRGRADRKAGSRADRRGIADKSSSGRRGGRSARSLAGHARLDATVGDGDTTFGELHADEETPALDEEVIVRQREYAVANALGQLPEAERQVLELRFGTAGEGEISLRDVSRRLEIPQARVRRARGSRAPPARRQQALEAWREAACKRPSLLHSARNAFEKPGSWSRSSRLRKPSPCSR